jgi:hypothetical protein
MNSCSYFYLLYSLYTKHRPDVLYLRQNSFPFFPIMLICKVLKIPLVVEVNGLVLDELASKYEFKIICVQGFFLILHFSSEKLNYKYCDRIVSVTDKLRDEIAQLVLIFLRIRSLLSIMGQIPIYSSLWTKNRVKSRT